MGVTLTLVPTESDRIKTLARQIRDAQHLDAILSDIVDPMMRAEVRMLLTPLVSFEVPAETE